MSFQILKSRYDALIKKAVAVRNAQNPEMKNVYRFMQMNNLPTIEELKSANIVPDETGDMDENILSYLIFYAETEVLDPDGDEWDYIFKPDEKEFSSAEIRQFAETRKYIEKVLQKCVEII